LKETSFINQNKEKWRKFENAYRANNHNPDELSNLFVEITEDLSFARTHYPKRTVRVYLNNLAQDVFTGLYRIRNKPFSRFIVFWTKSLPLEAFRMRKDMLIALIIFLVSAFIGVISTANDIEYAKVILGPDYIRMTDRHIEHWVNEQDGFKDDSKDSKENYKLSDDQFTGSPLKVYEYGDALPMFAMIFFNNIKVAFFSFILGLLFGIGTLIFLAFNGIMVGTFQSYFYYKGLVVGKGLFYATFLTIWIHGAFEISALVLSAACGLTLGRSLMFPKTMTRLQSLQSGAKRGLKVFIGISVFVLIAAILESWVTREYNMAEWLKLTIILGSFLIMFFVFVFIPFMVARKYPQEVEINENPTYSPDVNFNLYSIRNIADVMTDTFRLYRRHYASTFGILWKFILPLTFVFMYFNYEHYHYFYNHENEWYINCCLLFGVAPYDWILPALFWPVISGIFLAHVFYQIRKKEDPDYEPENYWRYMLMRSMEIALLFMPVTLVYQYSPGWVMLLFMFLLPLYLPVLFAITHEKGNFFARMGSGLNAGTIGYGNGIAVYFFILFLSAVFLGLFTYQVYWFTEDFIRWHLETRFENYQGILQLIKSFFFVLFFFHMIKLFTTGFILLYYHVKETMTSKGLYDKLESFGKQNKYYESNLNE
jgi:uncharacterized membrane protein SpoIIM required for sporulation